MRKRKENTLKEKREDNDSKRHSKEIRHREINLCLIDTLPYRAIGKPDDLGSDAALPCKPKGGAYRALDVGNKMGKIYISDTFRKLYYSDKPQGKPS